MEQIWPGQLQKLADEHLISMNSHYRNHCYTVLPYFDPVLLYNELSENWVSTGIHQAGRLLSDNSNDIFNSHVTFFGLLCLHKLKYIHLKLKTLQTTWDITESRVWRLCLNLIVAKWKFEVVLKMLRSNDTCNRFFLYPDLEKKCMILQPITTSAMCDRPTTSATESAVQCVEMPPK